MPEARKITATVFNALAEPFRLNYLWDYGSFIDERISYKRYVIKLYALHDFWVEVIYDMKNNRVTEDGCHALDEDGLDQLLKDIDLCPLFKNEGQAR